MKYVCVVLLVIPMLQSCYGDCSGKEVTCAGYQPPVANWFPYTSSQQLIFSSNIVKDTFTLSIRDSDPYRTTVSANKPWCTSSRNWISAEKTPAGTVKMEMYLEQRTDAYNGGTGGGMWKLMLYGTNFSGIADPATGIIETQSSGQTNQVLTSQIIGGTTYNNVQIISTDTTANKTARVYKVMLALNQGIVAFEEYPSRKLWVR